MTETGIDNDLHNTQAAEAQALTNECLLQECMAKIVRQDQAAFVWLYENLLGQVYGLALRMLKRTQQAEEVVQETFWQVWRQAPRFDAQRGSVKTWVLTIARSRALDHLRRIDAHEVELAPDQLVVVDATDEQMPPDILAAAQQGHCVQLALLKLDALPRQLISLAFFRGLSHSEIADHTGLPLGTVKSHIRQTLQLLRQQLTDAAEGVKIND
ncbi:MAG: sigma-70 family RNA polymerase sigma factor [Methylococcales bacterium]